MATYIYNSVQKVKITAGHGVYFIFLPPQGEVPKYNALFHPIKVAMNANGWSTCDTSPPYVIVPHDTRMGCI